LAAAIRPAPEEISLTAIPRTAPKAAIIVFGGKKSSPVTPKKSTTRQPQMQRQLSNSISMSHARTAVVAIRTTVDTNQRIRKTLLWLFAFSKYSATASIDAANRLKRLRVTADEIESVTSIAADKRLSKCPNEGMSVRRIHRIKIVTGAI
jgi:hypothetical protein